MVDEDGITNVVSATEYLNTNKFKPHFRREKSILLIQSCNESHLKRHLKRKKKEVFNIDYDFVLQLTELLSISIDDFLISFWILNKDWQIYARIIVQWVYSNKTYIEKEDAIFLRSFFEWYLHEFPDWPSKSESMRFD